MIINSTADLRNMLEEYYERVVELQGLDHKIEIRKMELMPKMISSMTGMPRSGNKKSDPTPETVIKWQEDETIKGYIERKKELREDFKQLKMLLNCLTDRQQQIIETYYINKKNGKVIARKLGVKYASVRNISSKAIVKMYKYYQKYYT